MATRQIINVDKVHKCHVSTTSGSEGSMLYDASTAYEAGTVVFYDGSLYCAIVDIEDTDTDTPVEAPAKWAIVLPMVLS